MFIVIASCQLLNFFTYQNSDLARPRTFMVRRRCSFQMMLNKKPSPSIGVGGGGGVGVDKEGKVNVKGK